MKVRFSTDGIPVEIEKVKDAGRYRIVDTRNGDVRIQLLVPEGESVATGSAHVQFDPAHTQIYADGWIVSEAAP